ncbi:MAG TPA: serine/threonine-protein kinase [Thermoanaerobaculia bacterium]|nr:serine/threonine-protein kinase [Thermoanaerobaculia bacterium]
MWLSDDAVAHLREIAETPELTGTRYELVRELGRGGMGIVYEAHDRELARNVAMKVADEHWRGEPRIIAALEHPGIVPVYDAGVLPDGRLYYTMKLVRGVRLDDWVREGHPRTERLRLFARICEPVAFAHANGVVHRDLKPENVMVGEFGAVLVMDWGVARVSDDDARVIVGTPGYMSPEQSRGEPADPRSDVYALGRILAFLAGDGAPRALEAIVKRATHADPHARYATARELAEDVLRFLDGEPVSAYRENVLERSARFLGRHRALVAMLLAYLLMRTIVLLWARL